MSDLLKINVNDHTEKKNGLTYLSWAWAWAEVLKVDPAARWVLVGWGEGVPFLHLPDGSVMVSVEVTIKGQARVSYLPVMDHRNKAVKSPDAMAVNTAVMRCLAKAIAMHGLGLYIYAGEDLPEAEQDDQPAHNDQVACHTDSLVPVLRQSIEQAKQKKAGVMGAVLADITLDAATESGLRKLAARITPLPPAEAYQVIEDNGLDSDERLFLWSLLDSKTRSALKREKETRQLAAMEKV